MIQITSKLYRLKQFFSKKEGLIFLLLLAIGSATYFGTTNHLGYRGGIADLDGYYYYIYLRSLSEDGDIQFKNEYQDWGNPFGFKQTQTGYSRNVFGIGPAIAWSPFYLVAKIGISIARQFDGSIIADPMSHNHQVITLYGSLIYGWLAIIFGYLIIRQFFPKLALLASVSAFFAGPLPYYCLSGASYSHAPAAFFATLSIYLWLKHRQSSSLRSWINLGFSIGLTILVRPAAAPLSLIIIIETFFLLFNPMNITTLKTRLVTLKGPALATCFAILAFSPQLFVWKILNGTFFLIPQGDSFLLLTENAWLQTLFAPRNGLLPSAPLYLLSFLGLLFSFRRENPKTAYTLWVVLVLTFILNGAVHDWWGWNFSARRYSFLFPIFALGLAASFNAMMKRVIRSPKRFAVILVISLSFIAISFNLEWMHQYRANNLKWYSVRSTQGLYLTVLHNMSKRVYDITGNPLSIPAAYDFAVKTNTSPEKYDRLEGSYLLGETNKETLPAAKEYIHAMVPLYQPRFRMNLSPQFGKSEQDGKISYVPLRSSHGFILLPINRKGDLSLWIRAKALYPNTKVGLSFNGKRLGNALSLKYNEWSTLYKKVPAAWVRRGINRLDLNHSLPSDFNAANTQHIGTTTYHSDQHIAATSGGKKKGTFCEIWFNEKRIKGARGLNFAIFNPKGKLLDFQSFDVMIFPSLFKEAKRYLDHFGDGNIVALCTKDDVSKYFSSHEGQELLARFGAIQDLSKEKEAGYAALGVIGAAPRTANESLSIHDHARVHVGRIPPPWRQAVWYSALRLR